MMRKIYNEFIRYLETNRLDNRDILTGWRRRVQDIYVACHRRENPPTAGSPPNLWQHYAKKK